MLDLNLIPTVFDPLYAKKVDNFTLLYNPYSQKGMTLFSKKAIMVFNHIDGIKSIKSCSKGTNLTRGEILQVFRNLYEHDIIDFKDHKRVTIKETSRNSTDLIMWIYLTEQCNFRCTYCFVDKNPKRMNESIMKKILEKLGEEAKKRPFKRIRLRLAGGEPLLEMNLIKKIIEMSAKIKKINKSIFDIDIITNGSLLTEKTADYFRKNMVGLTISLDGIGKFNNLTRKYSDGSGTFRYVKKGIEIAKKHSILSGISITITSKNIKGLPLLAKYCLENKIMMRFGFFKQLNNTLCNDNKIGDVATTMLYYKKTLRTIYSYYEKKRIFHSPLLDHSLLDDLKYLIVFSNSHCGAGSVYFSVSPEGNIQFCPASQLCLASICDEDFIQKARIASTPLLQKMSVEKIYECQKCLWKYICSGGCILERLYLNKDTSKPSYKCPMYKAMMPIILDFEAKRIIRTSFFQK